MSEREPGWYWVRSGTGFQQVALMRLLDSTEAWYLPGLDAVYGANELSEIGPRIDPPSAAPAPVSEDARIRAHACVAAFAGYEPGPRWASLCNDIAAAITAAVEADRIGRAYGPSDAKALIAAVDSAAPPPGHDAGSARIADVAEWRYLLLVERITAAVEAEREAAHAALREYALYNRYGIEARVSIAEAIRIVDDAIRAADFERGMKRFKKLLGLKDEPAQPQDGRTGE